MYHRQFQQQLLEIEKGTYRPRAPIEHRSDIPSGCHVLSLYPMRFPEDEEDAADSCNRSDMSSTSSRASVSYTSFRSVRAARGDQLRRSASSLLSLSALLTLQPQYQPMTARHSRGSRAPRFISPNSASEVSVVTRSRQEPMATLISSAHSL